MRGVIAMRTPLRGRLSSWSRSCIRTSARGKRGLVAYHTCSTRRTGAQSRDGAAHQSRGLGAQAIIRAAVPRGWPPSPRSCRTGASTAATALQEERVPAQRPGSGDQAFRCCPGRGSEGDRRSPRASAAARRNGYVRRRHTGAVPGRYVVTLDLSQGGMATESRKSSWFERQVQVSVLTAYTRLVRPPTRSMRGPSLHASPDTDSRS